MGTSSPISRPTPPPAKRPVMDIVPPRQAADAVKEAPQEEATAAPVGEAQQQETAPKQPAPKKALLSKPARHGVGLAIAATVIIVLGLGVLFVYAYLRTQSISLF